MSEEQAQWAIVELMGRREMAGKISTVAKYGTELLHIEMPMSDGESWLTAEVGGSSIYQVTNTTEEHARLYALRHQYAIGTLFPQLALPSASVAIQGLSAAVKAAGGMLEPEEETDEDKLTRTSDDFKGFLSSMLDGYKVDDDNVVAVAELVSGSLKLAITDFNAATDKQTDEKSVPPFKEMHAKLHGYDPEWTGDPDAEAASSENAGIDEG